MPMSKSISLSYNWLTHLTNDTKNPMSYVIRYTNALLLTKVRSAREDFKNWKDPFYEQAFILIHWANPQSRPVVIIVFTHVVRSYVHQYVCPQFSKQNKFQVKTMFTTGETVGLAEWIIDVWCHLSCFHFCLFKLSLIPITVYVMRLEE